VRSFRAFPRFLDSLKGVCSIEHRDWCQTHNGAVTCSFRVTGSTKRLAGFLELLEGSQYSAADVEAPTSAAPVSLSLPTKIAFHPVGRVEPFALDEALRQAKGHGGIVCPLTWLEIEGAPANHVRDRVEGTGPPELKRGADGIPHGKPEKAPPVFGHPLTGSYINKMSLKGGNES
jgi:hypothetical protein